MLRLDVTLELELPGKGPSMVASRKIALQGCNIVAFQGSRARDLHAMGTRDSSDRKMSGVLERQNQFADFALLLACGFFF